MKGLTDKEKDLVVSSEFAATLFSIQENVPPAFVDTAHSEKASYSRFRRYFKSDEFDSRDEKHEVIIIFRRYLKNDEFDSKDSLAYVEIWMIFQVTT